MCSLPIPDRDSPIRYSDILWDDVDLGKVVSDLTGNRIRPTTRAHLDPDIDPASLRRNKGWTGMFGPSRPAFTHLHRCGVTEGDLFLFFGWFRQAEWEDDCLRFVPDAPDIHVLFGWLKVDVIKPVERFSSVERRWADYHPHFSPRRASDEVICLGRNQMSLPSIQRPLPGFGVFPACRSVLCLTAPLSTRSRWRLPKWFWPGKDKTPLSRHADIRRWRRTSEWVYLDTVPIGQEFVLDCKEYPEAFEWLAEVFAGLM
jgi:hypothetical protein